MLIPHFFSLRYKLILAFLAISSFISIMLGYASYRILEQRMFEQFLQNVKTMAQLSTQIINREALEKIVALTRKPLSKKQIQTIQNSKERVLLVKQLDFIRSTNNLVRYIYLIAPTHDPNIAKNIVDASPLIPTRPPQIFNTDLHISTWPVMKRAFMEKTVLVENKYVYDETYHTYSVSGYAPVFAKDGKTFLALLGIDMVNKDVQNALKAVTKSSILVAAISLFISFLTAIILGIMLTNGIIRLDKLIQKFAENDLSARANLQSNDEIGRLGHSFNHMADTIQEFITASNRFVPVDFLKLMNKGSIVDVRLGDHILREMTVLFADVRNFTSISEKMSIKDNFNFINSYLKLLGPVIRNHNGIIDKYIGDGIFALFPGKVDDALKAALSMHEVLEDYNKSKYGARYHPVHIGVSIHHGRVMLGTVGEKQRMDGTVISDTVNLASRLESLTKYYNASIIISDKAVNELTQKENYFLRYLDKIRVVGKIEPVCIYEACDADPEKIILLKKNTLNDYVNAIDHFYNRRFKEAIKLFKQIMKINPNDKSSQIFYEKACYFVTHEPSNDWDGVTIHDKKKYEE
ncbi:TPA: adenylate/guanylate cyclase domain-containing protein [Legionella pneumophila]|nr:adenylate/guanylate cyclase domain-containing protein [Legionella pneumophila]HAT3975873.1 HAMP domain-containing protein [Legionella pneumophila]HAT8355884.1 HAMP domain-containing protein [Legionella pneumophila]HAU1206925.1 HAMP domain-containing protein [Legionella pneumophila]HAU1282995.1 HAMP domain-containing protein [Legionella pneumophila]HAU1959695.1 HAMP domain-containing protein [Legionella pneumophila]